MIKDRSFKFSLGIITLHRQLVADKEFVLSKQLLRSGTSIGANIVEAEAGISKADFTAKMAIASKEARETRYWLQLLQGSRLTKIDLEEQLNEIEEIIKIITAIVKTAQGQR